MVTKAQQAAIDAEFIEAKGPIIAPEYDQEFENIPDDVALTNLLSDLGEDENAGKVNVYKLVNGEFRSQMFLFSCTPSEFDLGMLQDPEYHKDEKEKHLFRVILRNSTGIATAKTLTIMPMAKKELPALTAPTVDLSPITAILVAMQEQTQALIRSIATPAQPARSTKQVLEEMLLMQQVMGTNTQQAPAQTQSPLELIKMAKELAVLINPEAAASNPLMDIVAKYAVPIMDTVMTAKQQQPAQQARIMQPAQPHPGTAPAIEAPPVVTPESETDVNFVQTTMLKQQLKSLVKHAERDADTVLYADLVLDLAGESILEPLNLPDWWENILKLCPEAEPHQFWFATLRAEILAQFLPETEENNLTDLNLNGNVENNQSAAEPDNGFIDLHNFHNPANTGGPGGHPANPESHEQVGEAGQTGVTSTT